MERDKETSGLYHIGDEEVIDQDDKLVITDVRLEILSPEYETIGDEGER